jgi:hypothetical protein
MGRPRASVNMRSCLVLPGSAPLRAWLASLAGLLAPQGLDRDTSGSMTVRRLRRRLGLGQTPCCVPLAGCRRRPCRPDSARARRRRSRRHRPRGHSQEGRAARRAGIRSRGRRRTAAPKDHSAVPLRGGARPPRGESPHLPAGTRGGRASAATLRFRMPSRMPSFRARRSVERACRTVWGERPRSSNCPSLCSTSSGRRRVSGVLASAAQYWATWRAYSVCVAGRRRGLQATIQRA